MMGFRYSLSCKLLLSFQAIAKVNKSLPDSIIVTLPTTDMDVTVTNESQAREIIAAQVRPPPI